MLNIRQSEHQLISPSIAVTGAAGGIGAEVARLAVDAGASVALLDRDEAGLERVRERLHKDGGAPIHTEVLDIADEGAVEAAFERIAAELGPVGGLVASAGIERLGVAHELSSKTFDEVMATNVRGTFLCARAAIAQMLKAEAGGAVVLVSSTFAKTAAAGITAYGTSKGAISALARSLAVDYASHGIRANALLPGPTDTALMWEGMSAERIAEVRELIAGEVPLGRLAKPAEPAAVALWLLSEQASYVTGSEIVCDGGVLAKSSVSV
jgi:NAD(P)-dependent dehydrogenase (short-subunit alcohol dehydrogenase family)